MESSKNDFVVDTKGHCFICLNQTEPKFLEIKDEKSSLTYSIQYLSRYLKLDMSKIFKGPVPKNLLEKVEKSKLKVELCSECSRLNKKLWKLFEQVEKIEMEIGFRLSSMCDKISNSEAVTRMEQIKNNFDNEDLSGKLEIAQVLREELKSKCSQKTTTCIIPQVKIEKTKWKKPVTKTNKIIRNGNDAESTKSCPIIIKDQIKLENYPDLTAENSNSDDDFLDVANDMIVPDDDSWNSSTSDSDSPTNSATKRQTVVIRRKSETTYLASNKIHVKRPSIAGNQDKNMAATVPSPIKSAGIENPGSIASMKIFNSGNGKHKCRVCSKEYAFYESFYMHFKTAHMKVRYSCPAPSCGKFFPQKISYVKHYENLHLGIRYQCQYSNCKEIFTQKCSLSSHMKKFHP